LTSPEHTATAREVLGDGAIVAPEQGLILESDPDRARAIARQFLARYLEAPNYTNNFRRLGFTEEDIAGGGSDRLVDALIAWGDEDALAARVKAHRDAGASHVCVQVLTAAEQPPFPRAEWRRLAPVLTS
jgi:probable F420-dependent oxidoreductase